jgi:hypothetical protein
MTPPLPPLHETPAALKALLTDEGDAQKPQRLQALSRLQTQQARTRRQVARRRGVQRATVGRWLTASASGGLAERRTMANAPGKAPLWSPPRQRARRDRLTPPHGVVSDHAVGQGLRQA